MLKNKFAKFLGKVGKKLINMSRRIKQPEAAKLINTWFAIKGDKTLRLNYSLDNESVVFDIGGYEGQWASDIYSMYQCKIYVFEPVYKYYQFIKGRFTLNEDIIVYNYGVSDKNANEVIYVDKDGSSFFRKNEKVVKQEAISVDIVDFVNRESIRKIDLMKINIEGGEYDLLDHIIYNRLVDNIDNIQIQFHDNYPDAENRMEKIQEKLSETHYITYQYRFIWENWRKIGM